MMDDSQSLWLGLPVDQFKEQVDEMKSKEIK
jgi:hypothetical protein